MNLFLPCALPIEQITAQEYERVIDHSELVVADRIGPKVMTLENENLIKIFRRKRLLSSAFFAPYALRFVNNALKLTEIGIHTVRPISILHCPEQQSHLVEYAPIKGELLRAALQNSTDNKLLADTARYIAKLHDKGVYFRSLHFENIIYDGNRFGLIDVADMKIYSRPLNKNLRERNFQHFLRYPPDAEIIGSYGLGKFRKDYEDAGAT